MLAFVFRKLKESQDSKGIVSFDNEVMFGCLIVDFRQVFLLLQFCFGSEFYW